VQVCELFFRNHTYLECTAPTGQGTVDVIVAVGGPSAIAAFTYNAPVITDVQPDTALPTEGGVTLTISGTNFGTEGTVTVGGALCAPSVWEHTRTECTLPPGQGLDQAVLVYLCVVNTVCACNSPLYA